jgi:hypothetical protein
MSSFLADSAERMGESVRQDAVSRGRRRPARPNLACLYQVDG